MHKLLIFNDEMLLFRALTHRSYSANHNERLEFLGDAILNFICAEYLYQIYPQIEEGEMTRRRSALVDEKQLAQFAIKLDLDRMMILDKNTIQQGGLENSKLLSSTFEAVVGAYYLDNNGNTKKVKLVLEELFNSVDQDIFLDRSSLDSKNKLQEFVQANGIDSDPPMYKTKQIGGTDHKPEFMSSVYISKQLYGTGKAGKKKEAEKRAADDALNKLRQYQV